MVDFRLDFELYTPSDVVRVLWPWISDVDWFNGPVEIGPQPGLYIIDNGVRPLYAGQAENIPARFRTRSRAMREFRFTAAARLTNYRVFSIDVTADQPGFDGIDTVEHWLVRFLAIYDAANSPNLLQNIDLTTPREFEVNIGIRFNPANAPAYLINGPSYNLAPPNGPGYNYLADTAF